MQFAECEMVTGTSPRKSERSCYFAEYTVLADLRGTVSHRLLQQSTGTMPSAQIV
jgi:hypothetical protein